MATVIRHSGTPGRTLAPALSTNLAALSPPLYRYLPHRPARHQGSEEEGLPAAAEAEAEVEAGK